MLKPLYKNSQLAAKALSFAAAALLALALAVGANSGILSLSEFTHARSSILSAERYYELKSITVSETFPGSICNSNKPQDQGDQSEQIKNRASQSFDLRLGKSLFNRRVLICKF